MKLNQSKFIYFIILLTILQAGFVRYWYNKTIDDIGSNITNISKVVANSIDVEKYEQITKSKLRNDYFYKMQDYFLKIQKETGVKYLYVEHKISKSQIEYIFDAEKDSLGEIDKNTIPAAHLHKESINTRLEDYSIWGTLITGITPIINKDGEVVGAVGVDVDKDFFMKELNNRILIIALYCLITIVLYSFLIWRLIIENSNRKKAQSELQKSTKSLRDILNNTNQGFLTLDKNLCVNQEYSSTCYDIFNQEIYSKHFPGLTYTNDNRQAEYFSEILKEVLDEKDEFKRSIIFR